MPSGITSDKRCNLAQSDGSFQRMSQSGIRLNPIRSVSDQSRIVMEKMPTSRPSGHYRQVMEKTAPSGSSIQSRPISFKEAASGPSSKRSEVQKNIPIGYKSSAEKRHFSVDRNSDRQKKKPEEAQGTKPKRVSKLILQDGGLKVGIAVNITR